MPNGWCGRERGNKGTVWACWQNMKKLYAQKTRKEKTHEHLHCLVCTKFFHKELALFGYLVYFPIAVSVNWVVMGTALGYCAERVVT